jgi:uncharacterized protein (DUF1697 family)
MSQYRQICFLRAVNVGGKNRIKMSELIASLQTAIKPALIETYIQSGNVVLSYSHAKHMLSTDEVERRVSKVIKRDFNLEIEAIARSFGDLRKELSKNPYQRFVDKGAARIYLGFLQREPEPQALKALALKASKGIEYTVQGRSVFMYSAAGMGTARLPPFEKVLGVSVTFRNLKVLKEILFKFSGASAMTQ